MAAPDNDHPAIKDVPIGLPAKDSRREFDSMGDVEVSVGGSRCGLGGSGLGYSALPPGNFIAVHGLRRC